jgi:hypothetical protein
MTRLPAVLFIPTLGVGAGAGRIGVLLWQALQCAQRWWSAAAISFIVQSECLVHDSRAVYDGRHIRYVGGRHANGSFPRWITFELTDTKE